MVEVDSKEGSSLLSVPSQIIVREDDRLTSPLAAKELQQSVAGSALTTIPKAGHLSNIGCRDPFNQSVLAFLLKLH